MEQKKLSVGDRSFRSIILGNYLYADKTKYIYNMLKNYNCCFLSRPRRFGKTLLIKTIGELFKGERQLFEGLWIDTESDYGFEKHPVLNFNMSYSETDTKSRLIARIKDDLRDAGKRQGVKISSRSTCDKMMGQLLEGIYEKSGVGAVVLVDEYDAPVIDHILDLKLASDNCKVLHDFYRSMKTNIDYIHFALVTGITRFAMTSMDSGPNNFKDISILANFAGICGFTIGELDSLFQDRFEETLASLKTNKRIAWNAGFKALKNKILEWYDGYNWLGDEHILNPYSILNFFDKKNFPHTGHQQDSHPTYPPWSNKILWNSSSLDWTDILSRKSGKQNYLNLRQCLYFSTAAI
ncbi:MAG: AAA family ATPase [Deltaproteobacteria bacterium]|nr:AAA family ATPase [Deltaproteobacteria bacterium]